MNYVIYILKVVQKKHCVLGVCVCVHVYMFVCNDSEANRVKC